MDAIAVAYTAVAAGNFLWQLTGQEGLPPIVGSGVGLWDRLASLTKSGRRNAKVKQAIQAALAGPDHTAADAADVAAADQAVARVLASAHPDQQQIAAVRHKDRLHELLAPKATEERAALISQPAQGVFDFILGATEAFLVKSALESEDFAKFAQQEELRDLADLAEEIRTLSGLLSTIPAETAGMLAGPLLTLSPPVTPRGAPVEPSRLLAPTSGAFPFVDRDDLLGALTAWVDDAAPFAVQIVGGLGGSGKSRLAVELCQLLLNTRGGYWRAGFQNSRTSAAALSALAKTPGGRLIVLDYAETRVEEVSAVLTSLSPSATWLQPVRVLLLVRNPLQGSVGGPPLSSDKEPWRAAVRPLADEAANTLLDDAGILTLPGGSLTIDDRELLFSQAVNGLPVYMGLPIGASVRHEDTDFLNRTEYDQPLYVAMAAYLFVSGERPVMNGSQALFEGVLRHEAKYWERSASLPGIGLTLNEPELRLLVALATVTDVTDDTEALALLEHIRFLRGDANALRRERAYRWLHQLYPSQGCRWGQIFPDRLGEYVIAQQFADKPELVRAVLSPSRSPSHLLRPLLALARATAGGFDTSASVRERLADALPALGALCGELTTGALTEIFAMPGPDRARGPGPERLRMAQSLSSALHYADRVTRGEPSTPPLAISPDQLSTPGPTRSEFARHRHRPPVPSTSGPEDAASKVAAMAREAADVYRAYARENAGNEVVAFSESIDTYIGQLDLSTNSTGVPSHELEADSPQGLGVST